MLLSLLAVDHWVNGAAAFKRDLPGQPFRRAPMAESSRSIVIPLATDLHLAFDAQLLLTHTVLSGPGLNLRGPPYTGAKSPFLCDFAAEALWGNPPISPWRAGSRAGGDFWKRPRGTGFRGISTKGGVTTLIYEVAVGPGKSVRVHELPRGEMIGEVAGVIRRFEIAPCAQDLFYLAHAVLNRGSCVTNLPSALTIERPKDWLTVVVLGDSPLTWSSEQEEVDYPIALQAEKGGQGLDSAVKTNRVAGMESRAWLRIPAHPDDLAFELFSFVSREKPGTAALASLAKTPVAPPKMAFIAGSEKDSRAPPPKVVGRDESFTRAQGGDRFYRIEHFPVPKEIELLVGGMDWLSNGDLAVCTWPGEVYIVQNATGPVAEASYRRLARGLNEPLGLKVVHDQIYVAQKCELTRLVDTDGNGEADLYQTVSDDWGFTGNYHSFAFGPAAGRADNLYVFLAGQRGRWDVPYVGWCVEINPVGGRTEGFCSGLRAPNGWATYGPDQELFVTDNQGEWVGACKLNHLRRGKFYGFPSGYPASEAAYEQAKTFEPPAVWFPRKLAPSASGIAVITDDRFGPFQGQMLVGDFQNGIVTRVALERVNGEWQGAVWPFARGFLGAVNRLSMGPDGNVYVGGCKRAWATAAPLEYSLERMSFTGETPFEVKEVHAKRDGLELIFTTPVDARAATDPENYAVSQFAYKYSASYGSPELDHDGNENSSTPIEMVGAAVAAGGSKVRLSLKGWRAGYVTAVRMRNVLSAARQGLWHDEFYYTLNRVPE